MSNYSFIFHIVVYLNSQNETKREREQRPGSSLIRRTERSGASVLAIRLFAEWNVVERASWQFAYSQNGT